MMARRLVLLAVACSMVAAWVTLGVRTRQLIAAHGDDARLSRAEALAVPGRAFGAREDVLAWAAALIPTHARVYLQCPQPGSCSNPLANWITYRLSPRVFTDSAADADWVLVYRSGPSGITGARAVWRFSPGFAVLRRRS